MPFGHKVIKLIDTVGTGVFDDAGIEQRTEAVTDAPGCRHRPLTFSETAELEFDVATELWKSTIPLFEYSDELQAKVRGLEADKVIRVDGEDYQIVGGVKCHDDFEAPFKATIISKQQHG